MIVQRPASKTAIIGCELSIRDMYKILIVLLSNMTVMLIGI